MSSASMELQHPGSFYTMSNRMSSKVPLTLMMPSASSSLSTGSYHSSPSRENGNGGDGGGATANGHNIIYFLNTDSNNNNRNNNNNETQDQGCRFPDSSLSLQTRNGIIPEKPLEDGKVTTMNGHFVEYANSEHGKLQQACDLNNTLDMSHSAAYRTSSTSFMQGPPPTSASHVLHPSTTCAPAMTSSELHGHPPSTSGYHGLRSVTSSLHGPPPLPTSDPGLTRHTSLPVNVLSRLAMEESSQAPLYYDSSTALGNNPEMVSVDENRSSVYLMPPKGSLQSMSNSYYMDMGNGGYTNGDGKNNRLIRHSSSPADLLSDMSSDEFSHGVDKVSMSSFGLGVHDRKLKQGRHDDINGAKAANTNNMHLGLLYGSSSEGLHQFGVHGAANDLAVDLIICKSRAKRGCATHPRSIAERVRRTKISERMRKLQDLVPNLDKQAHIADMLDEVVEYVKDLQQQVQDLSTNRCRCKRQNQNKDITSLKM